MSRRTSIYFIFFKETLQISFLRNLAESTETPKYLNH